MAVKLRRQIKSKEKIEFRIEEKIENAWALIVVKTDSLRKEYSSLMKIARSNLSILTVFEAPEQSIHIIASNYSFKIKVTKTI